MDIAACTVIAAATTDGPVTGMAVTVAGMLVAGTTGMWALPIAAVAVPDSTAAVAVVDSTVVAAAMPAVDTGNFFVS
jgi:hypothetical protein